jgi:4-carboxymuconolactone decarboxylase
MNGAKTENKGQPDVPAQHKELGKSRRERGVDILRHVVGDELYEKRRNSTNGFNEDVRRLSEEYCFGEIWTRPGLAPKIRSLLCIGMLTALNRATELRIHINGAINNGCTVQEIKEVLLQSVIYCGLPAGVDAIRIAEEALRERGIDLG